MTTGEHVIRDLSCLYCKRKLGWKYISAAQPSQQYKVGHCILELAFIQEVRNEFHKPCSDEY